MSASEIPENKGDTPSTVDDQLRAAAALSGDAAGIPITPNDMKDPKVRSAAETALAVDSMLLPSLGFVSEAINLVRGVWGAYKLIGKAKLDLPVEPDRVPGGKHPQAWLIKPSGGAVTRFEPHAISRARSLSAAQMRESSLPEPYTMGSVEGVHTEHSFPDNDVAVARYFDADKPMEMQMQTRLGKFSGHMYTETVGDPRTAEIDSLDGSKYVESNRFMRVDGKIVDSVAKFASGVKVYSSPENMGLFGKFSSFRQTLIMRPGSPDQILLGEQPELFDNLFGKQ